MSPCTLLLIACLGVACPTLAGCDISMERQGKYKTEAPAPLFADGTSAQTPPDDTVAQGALAEEQAAQTPPPATPALLARGRERHDIFCKPCHGVSGEGDGMIVSRGFPRPPSYQDPHVRQATAAHLFDVITHGSGVMFPYAERIPAQDRWAIVAYIRALETTHDLDISGRPSPRTAGGRGS
ncbi:cytochrome c [Caulobacter sp. S45]|uniref:c-type cytochrome n=1 Tax=Caulobacter sp. S45 TaxID=1641861 RepID=UPI001C209610|nr:cytochrome c [Caulobacter sp. S45]